jgi:hypothetical protein
MHAGFFGDRFGAILGEDEPTELPPVERLRLVRELPAEARQERAELPAAGIEQPAEALFRIAGLEQGAPDR